MSKVDIGSNTNEAIPMGEKLFEPGLLNFTYILYLVGFVFPIAPLIGLVIAYLQESSGHRQFAIRTFWIGVLMCVVGSVLTLVLIGWLILLFWSIWTITRVVSAYMLLNKGADVAIPKSWGFLAK